MLFWYLILHHKAPSQAAIHAKYSIENDTKAADLPYRCHLTCRRINRIYMRRHTPIMLDKQEQHSTKLLYGPWGRRESASCCWYHIIFHYVGIHFRTWWRHQMEKRSALLALCERNPPVTGRFPSQRPVTRSFEFLMICAWTNGWASNRNADDLSRHRAHYDVTVRRAGAIPVNMAEAGVHGITWRWHRTWKRFWITGLL